MKIKNDKEIIIGKVFGSFGAEHEVPFFVRDVTDIGYDPKSECNELKFFVYASLEKIYINENDFKYLLNKYRGNHDEN